MIKRFDELTQIIAKQIDTAHQLATHDLTALITNNETKLQEISAKIDRIQQQAHSLQTTNLMSYADKVKSGPPPSTTIVIKPKENGPTLKEIQDSIDNANWPPNLVIANKKARFNHLEIRPVTL